MGMRRGSGAVHAGVADVFRVSTGSYEDRLERSAREEGEVVRLIWTVLALIVIAAVIWVASLPVHGEPCKIEGESKFHSTGNVVVCTNGVWEKRRGVKF